MNINLNGSVVDITEVNFNGSAAVDEVHLNGTMVWQKAPSAQAIAQGLYTSFNSWIKGDAGNVSAAPGSRIEYSNTTDFRNIGTHTETFSGYNISESSPLDSSPNNTAVFIQYGSDSGGNITTLKVNGSGITETDSVNSTAGTVSVGHTSVALESISNIGATFAGTTGNTSDFVHSMVLPGKWDVTSVSSGATLIPGDILIFAGQGGGDSYDASWNPSSWMSGPTNVLSRQRWWYSRALCGIWVNKTASNITASFTAPATGIMVRLRHIGI
tara:strand:+ start:408 stop:1220 length:813 start_codon:yes stop_codon:yes gene_type:complete